MADQFTHLAYGALTDVGTRRKNNEDSILTLPRHGMYCVADGMGGVQGGEVASQAAVTYLEKAFDKLEGPEAAASVASKAQTVDRALNAASHWIKRRSDKKGTKGSGTTAIALVFDGRNPHYAMILHAGDSRAYRFRNDALTQLSKDHTVAAAAGLEDDADLPAMFRGVVTRAVGVKAAVDVEKTLVEVEPGDVYLLSSDGLDKMVSDPEIEERIREHGDGDLQELAQVLVDDTNRNGGVDNVSVILVRVNPVPPEATTTGNEEVREEIAAYLAEDERRRELGIVEDVGDDERQTSEDATPKSGTMEGVTPSHRSDEERDTDDRSDLGLDPEAGPAWLRKWLGLPAGFRYALVVGVIVLAALVFAQIRRGREAARGDDIDLDLGSPVAEAQHEIESDPSPKGAVAIPVLLPEETPEPEEQLTPEEELARTAANVEQTLQALEASAQTLDTPATEEPAGAEPAVEPVEEMDPAEKARLEKERRQREREERAARSPQRQAEVRAGLTGKVNDALETGQWGRLSDYVEQWGQYVDGLMEDSGHALVYHSWLNEWRNARDRADEVGAWLEAYESEMAGIFTACGFAVPDRPGGAIEGTPEERADLYCARRRLWQTDLAQRVRAFVEPHRVQSGLLPNDAQRLLSNIWLFTGQTDTSGAEALARRLAEARAELDRLETWLAVQTEEPFPAADLGAVPMESVPVVTETFNEIWAGLDDTVALIAPQLSAWRNWEDETLAERLDVIDDLQKEVVLSREAFGDDSAAWRMSADHEALARLLRQIDKVYPLLRRKIGTATR